MGCKFVEQLARLRKLSAESVDNTNAFDEFKEYGENRSIKEERELSYRKYFSVLTGFEHEMFVSICSDDTFHYYPYLSDMTGGYISHDSDLEHDFTNEDPIVEEQVE